MYIFYRISDGSYKKLKFKNATKENCLRNFLRQFREPTDDLFLYLDNVSDNTFKMVSDVLEQNCEMEKQVIRTNAGSSAGSFRLVMKEALKLDDDEIIYFAEDDYAYLPNSRKVILEGLERADCCSLYDHMDKYIPSSQGGNPLVTDEGYSKFPTFVIRTSSVHWRTVDSTTMTFATTVGVLRKDQDVWSKHTEGTHPYDMNIFHELSKRGRSLITPIPSYATHCEPRWAAPGINWEEEI